MASEKLGAHLIRPVTLLRFGFTGGYRLRVPVGFFWNFCGCFTSLSLFWEPRIGPVVSFRALVLKRCWIQLPERTGVGRIL
jgi:hypothetical protein